MNYITTSKLQDQENLPVELTPVPSSNPIKLPDHFTITYIADECEDEYELTDCFVPRIYLRCCECNRTHCYEARYVTQAITEEWFKVVE